MNATALEASDDASQDYRPLFEIGHGGMARVYLAESLISGIRKLVVLKILKPEYCAYPDIRAAFRREAELAAQMNHPNVVQVLAVVDSTELPMIVMEYLDGVPLSAILKKTDLPLTRALRLHILTQVLAGLHHFHELTALDGTCLQAVHRDVSPQNVMVLHEGPVKVLDFGVAKVNAPDSESTRAGTIKGKLQYMSPEQLMAGSVVDRRSDIFAVGIMLWEALANRRLWEGKTEVELLRSLAAGALPNLRDHAPDVSDAMLAIVQSSTALDRERRYSTARQMQSAIEQVLAAEHAPIQTRDIAHFMALHFGERRRAQQLLVRDALLTARGTNPPADRTSEARLRTRPDRPVNLRRFTGWDSDFAALPSTRPIWLRRTWQIGAVACLVPVALWTLWPRKSASHLTTATREAAMVNLEITVVPNDAEILLDGKFVGKGHYEEHRPASSRPVALEVHAPDYLSERQQIRLTENTSLRISLSQTIQTTEQRHAGLPPTGPKSSSMSPRAASTSVAGTTKRTLHAKGVSSRHCQPPYTFSADGIKTYKPECF